MSISKPVWTTPTAFVRATRPEFPVAFFAPEVLRENARTFQDGFPGLVTYAVKSNPERVVVENLVAAGVTAFDVASVAEIELMRSVSPMLDLHYNNPVRSRTEIRQAVALGVKSYSVDAESELLKLADLMAPEGVEVSVRFKLPVQGAVYNFGSKFGATPEVAVDLLHLAAKLGFTPSLTFHPGTQCVDPEAWRKYLGIAAEIAQKAHVTISRLNVGGGFPSFRAQAMGAPDLSAIFKVIGEAATAAFGDDLPALVCEPGRAMVAEAFSTLVQVRGVRNDDVFVNDGIYGLLSELPLIGMLDRSEVRKPDGSKHPTKERHEARIFGPTCDSMDVLPQPLAVPADIAEEDYILFHGMGAYSTATSTRFNGFGDYAIVTVSSLQD